MLHSIKLRQDTIFVSNRPVSRLITQDQANTALNMVVWTLNTVIKNFYNQSYFKHLITHLRRASTSPRSKANCKGMCKLWLLIVLKGKS